MIKTIFIGNESVFLKTIDKTFDLNLIVCERINNKTKKAFGSAFDYAKENKIKSVSPQRFFNKPIPIDLIIVSGYSRLIPPHIISHPRIGIANIHQSLLPLYRGRHPLNWALIKGEKYTGVTIHHINRRFDAGNIILQEKVKIEENDTVMNIYWKTVEKGKGLICRLARIIGQKRFAGIKQDENKATIYPVRKPEDGEINWRDSAINIKNLIRALAEPYPGAYFYLKGKKIIIDEAEIIRHCDFNNVRIGSPFLFNRRIIIRTGSGFLKINKIRNKMNILSSIL